MNLSLLSRISGQAWAVRREHLALLPSLILNRGGSNDVVTRARGEQFAQAGYVPFSWDAWDRASEDSLPVVPQGTTVMMVWGMLGRGWTEEEKYYLGAIELDDVAEAISATPPGSTVALWFRSPGGIITGTPETAAFLREAGKTRNLVAFTDDLCASAAYWLAAQCEEIHATPTADVGSIGVYIAFYDWSEYLAKAGVKLELFKAGTMKAMGVPGSKLTEEQSAHLQAGVDEGYRQFTADVLANRMVASEFMQGQTLRGAGAMGANLVDRFHSSAAAFFAGLRG